MQAMVSPYDELPPTRRRQSDVAARVFTAGSRVTDSSDARASHAVSFVEVETIAAVEDVIPRERSEQLSRLLNISVALVATLLLSPLLAVLSLLVKLTSPGPVFYSQVRVGVDRRFQRTSTYDRRGYDHGGKPFMMFKFRTMRADAEKDGRAVWAVKQDPRVTAIGNFLRRTRLDELPQLLNVIRGDMNIVGPRPERPTIFADLRRSIPEYALRQRVKPGITGWAQINLAYDACMEDVRNKVQLDIEYIKRQGFWHDLRIMAMTIPVMIFRKGSR